LGQANLVRGAQRMAHDCLGLTEEESSSSVDRR